MYRRGELGVMAVDERLKAESDRVCWVEYLPPTKLSARERSSRVTGLRFGFSGIDFRASGLGSRIWDFGIRVSGLFGFLVPAFRFQVSSLLGFRNWSFGLRVLGLGSQVSGFRFRDSGFGFRVLGFGSRMWGVNIAEARAPREGE